MCDEHRLNLAHEALGEAKKEINTLSFKLGQVMAHKSMAIMKCDELLGYISEYSDDRCRADVDAIIDDYMKFKMKLLQPLLELYKSGEEK